MIKKKKKETFRPRKFKSIGLTKKFVWFFHNILQKNLNELSGQPNI